MITPRDVIPASWTALLSNGPLSWGLDIATTEKKTSNPSALVINEKVGLMEFERLVLAWKTADPDVTWAILELMFADLQAIGRNFKGGGIDGSNEKFYGKQLKDAFRKFCPIYVISGNEKLKYGMKEFDAKTLQGSLYVEAYTDKRIATPSAVWIQDDRRLVKRDKGRFECDLGREGQHGDTFDAGKQAHWVQVRKGGPVSAQGVSVSDGVSLPQRPQRQGLRRGIDDTHEYGTAKLNL